MSDLRYNYHPQRGMGHPAATSMADAADQLDTRLIVNAIEQVAYEARTASLIAYMQTFGSETKQFVAILNEIHARLGLSPGDWEDRA